MKPEWQRKKKNKKNTEVDEEDGGGGEVVPFIKSTVTPQKVFLLIS